ncbi:MAG: sugar phosphate isomerase/epimerase family protein [Runella sp.]
MQRRQFLQVSLAATAAASVQAQGWGVGEKPQISVFSKMLQWLEDYNLLAATTAEIGFDGLDLTVRPAGHVLPERVEDDLPRLVAACQKYKVAVPMMVSSILEADKTTEKILKTAQSVGVKHYRMGWYKFDTSKDLKKQVADFGSKMKDLAALNKQYGIVGQYQNHAGQYFGAAIWDLYEVLSKINSPFLGSQYDINHATSEAGKSWEVGFHLIAPHIKSLAIKDFVWYRKQDKWDKLGCPLNEGMVDWKRFWELVREKKLAVPFTMHYEYPLGGAENGAKKLSISRQEIVGAMQKDLKLVKDWVS